MLLVRLRTLALLGLLVTITAGANADGNPLAPARSGNLGLYRSSKNTQIAGLHPLLEWRRVIDPHQPLDGPVLYQIIFRSNATPGSIPTISPSFTLTNSLISQSGNTISVSGNLSATGKFTGDGSGLTGINSNSGGTVTSVTAGPGLSGGTITNSGTFSLNTGFTDARYLQLSGGTMIGLITFANGQTFPGSGAGNFLPLTGGTLTGNLNGTTASFISANGIGVEGFVTATTGSPIGVQGKTASPTGFGVAGNNTATSGAAFAVFGDSSSPNGTGVYGTVSSNVDSANAIGVQGVTGSPSGTGVSGLALDATGGTTGALGSFGVQGQSDSPNGIGVQGVVNSTKIGAFTIGVQGTTSSPNAWGVYGEATDTSATGATTGVRALTKSPNGFGVFGVASDTTVAGSTIGVFGRSKSPNGVGVLGFADDKTGTGTSAQPTTAGVQGIANTVMGTAGFFANQGVGCQGSASCEILVAAVLPNGTTSLVNVMSVRGDGHVHAAAYDVGGADFAESVSVRGARAQYEPGDVMIIDEAGNRILAKAREPYSTLVAGIVSTKPGVLASIHNTAATGAEKLLDSEIPLAVVGIVPCKVSAENGAIHAGDLLVASSTPGYAMKGTDRARMLGAVVGKAMQSLESGKGIIEVLVTLQ